MSFYGNILYELTNAFSKIIIKNYNTDPVALEGFGLNNALEISSGNKWIQLGPNADNLSFTIIHAARDQSDTSNTATGLTKLEEAEDAIQLSPGDYLESSQFFYDNAGHISYTNPVRFRLPVSETEKDLSNIQDRLSILEEASGGYEDQLKQHTEQIGSAKEIAEGAASDLSELDRRVGSQFNMTLDDYTTITGAIGSFDKMKQTTTYTTICSGIEALRSGLDGQNVVISNNALATRLATQRLCEKLSEHDIKINYEDLWKE